MLSPKGDSSAIMVKSKVISSWMGYQWMPHMKLSLALYRVEYIVPKESISPTLVVPHSCKRNGIMNESLSARAEGAVEI